MDNTERQRQLQLADTLIRQTVNELLAGGLPDRVIVGVLCMAAGNLLRREIPSEDQQRQVLGIALEIGLGIRDPLGAFHLT
jgi:hypothetical protein